MQLRMSPGAGTPCSLRRRPLGATIVGYGVTMAVSEEMKGASGAGEEIAVGEMARTWRLSPRSRVERPLPPPMATTRRPSGRLDGTRGGHRFVRCREAGGTSLGIRYGSCPPPAHAPTVPSG